MGITTAEAETAAGTTEVARAVVNGAPRSKRGEPTWEMTDFYPRQGEWTEEDYLALNTNRLIEFTDGVLEFLPMPTLAHQRLVKFLFSLLDEFVTKNRLGEVNFAPLQVRLFEGKKWREPDIVYLNREQVKAADKQYPTGADLVVEVVSGGEEDRRRDLEQKPVEYAEAGIKEYWIVDPETKTVKVLTLDGNKYKTHGEFKPGESATSALFTDFSVKVADVFAAAESETDTPDEETTTKDAADE